MPPIIYPHRTNGRGADPLMREWACDQPGCREFAISDEPYPPDCPVHQIPMKEEG